MAKHRTRIVFKTLLLLLATRESWSFLDVVPPVTIPRRNHYETIAGVIHSSTTLGMGGLNKARNKQAALQKKMEAAKKLKEQGEGGESDNEKIKKEAPRALSAEEIKERNDRKRFEELLQRQGSSFLNDYSSDGYLNRNQEEEEITAARAGVERIFEGDPAPTDCFEELVSSTTGNKLAKKGAQRLVPWLSKNLDADWDDYLVIVCDPREKSIDFHQTIKTLQAELQGDLKRRLIYINADTPAENRRWLKKNNLQNVEIYCDTKDKDWMRTFTALGETRWSMTVFVLRDRRVAKLARDLDVYNSSKSIQNAVKSMKSEAR